MKPQERKATTPPAVLIDLSGRDSPPSSPTSRPPTRSDESLPKIASWTWTTPLQADEMTDVRNITSKPHNHAIIALIGKVQIRWSKLHCLRPFYSSDPPESYYLMMTLFQQHYTSSRQLKTQIALSASAGHAIQAFTTLSSTPNQVEIGMRH